MAGAAPASAQPKDTTPAAAVLQLGYHTTQVMMAENGGKAPDMSLVLKRIESDLRSALEDGETQQPTSPPLQGSKGAAITPKSGAKAAPPVKKVEEMSETERRRAAIDELNRIERELARAPSS